MAASLASSTFVSPSLRAASPSLHVPKQHGSVRVMCNTHTQTHTHTCARTHTSARTHTHILHDPVQQEQSRLVRVKLRKHNLLQDIQPHHEPFPFSGHTMSIMPFSLASCIMNGRHHVSRSQVWVQAYLTVTSRHHVPCPFNGHMMSIMHFSLELST